MITVVSYGGGTNSVAMLVGLWERGERPDHIVFADTGGEKPHTYAHLWTMQAWCDRVGFPSIQIVRGEQPQQRKDGSLEMECLRLGALPSKAYGFGACSDKWKMDPYRKWARQRGLEHAIKLVGFHAGEAHRCLGVPESLRSERRYPLIEWEWDQDECRAAIKRAELPQPGKSACFFCPSTKKAEILDLAVRYPDLLMRALAIERRAMVGEGQVPAARCGLGRSLVWHDFLGLGRQPHLFPDAPEDCTGEACFT